MLLMVGRVRNGSIISERVWESRMELSCSESEIRNLNSCHLTMYTVV